PGQRPGGWGRQTPLNEPRRGGIGQPRATPWVWGATPWVWGATPWVWGATPWVWGATPWVWGRTTWGRGRPRLFDALKGRYNSGTTRLMPPFQGSSTGGCRPHPQGVALGCPMPPLRGSGTTHLAVLSETVP